MNQSVEHYISELLFLHDCVIVPGFGGFVGNKMSAQLNKTTGVLTPPSKQILFNRKLLTNDGLLILHIANKESITQEEAKKHIAKFVNESNLKLDRSKILRIAKIGLFTIGKDGNIMFLQDSATNYSLNAFGLKSTYKKPCKRTSSTSQELNSTIDKIKNTKQNYKLLLRAAAVLIPLITLSYLSISQNEKINDVYAQMATFNPLSKNEIIKHTTQPDVKEKVNGVYENSLTNIDDIDYIIVEETEEVFETLDHKQHYIIAGAFSEEKNAIRMVNKLKTWNYNAKILEGGSLLRVCYDSFLNRESAILALNNIRKENPEAWLLTE